MRWNCPHCEALVTAGIDFESTKRAYVRCTKCNGMAVIQMASTARVGSDGSVSIETSVQAQNASTSPSPSAPAPRVVTPPPFRGNATEAAAPVSTSTAPTPIFAFPKPPAFLLKKGAEKAFAETQERVQEAITEFNKESATHVNIAESIGTAVSPLQMNVEIVSETVTSGLATSPRLTRSKSYGSAAVWIAAVIAIASGIFLFIQGKRLLSPQAGIAPNGDQIISKSSSGIQLTGGNLARSLGIVKVRRATVRSLPSSESAALGGLDQASVITLLGEKDGWLRVETPKLNVKNNQAWIKADLITQIPN